MGLLFSFHSHDTLYLLLQSALALLVTASAYALYRGYQVRRMFQSLKKQGIPLMRHSMILGHLEVIGKLMSRLPSDAHGDYMMVMIQENWQKLFPDCSKCPPVLYIDLWPFAAPMLISINPDTSCQCTQDYSLPKAYQQKRTLYPLTRNRDVSSMEGAEWKVWRKRLNPGFSIQNITSRISDILDEVEVFGNVLEARAGKDGAWGEVFPLEEATTNLAMDVILRFFLNKRFHQQTGPRSPITIALLDTISRMFFYVNIFNFLSYINPWRHFKLWLNYRTLLNCLSPFLKERIFEIQKNSQVTNKTLVDLLVKSMEEEKGPDGAGTDLSTNTEFLETAIGQITTFLFAGHDTTASTICWLFRLLEQHPDVLAKLRAEHDVVLGPDPTQAVAALRANPQLLNTLTYTNAVLKESARVHTNVGTMRRGEPGFFLVGPPGSGPECEGKHMPTDGFVVWDGNFAIHRSPDVWPRPNEFIPERFLVTDENDPLHPPKNAWRFFELGPRGCIGQHLATVEIKLVLALVARRFDVECAWDEWDSQLNFKGPRNMVWEDRCYQVGGDSPPHVKDGMPVHVRVRS
ncbi:cytochrome P450 [Aspergillus pseudotamarii]|uniref:Cytochrome P450 n=1 Tax=Aspergillus pseudotamarii TaxID=132259 RepID=A0A5N6TBM3_ASPPS|nr:cytochrome P450 [Aspergillus pseudotamarii]KAE8143702.1 cytochrome P450 [Aspergillus pseudotamarii]